ncbi:hypothetical protein VM636_01290 [Streptomyces sp. SCSIO 75703]|uniref:hypothetical protein n=1 Tax=unclassified Streptomyces TaxID=2593676 RepID=UPI00055F6FD6|nr:MULTISPECIES: hypothetical protein [unclassified Streptomyces]
MVIVAVLLLPCLGLLLLTMTFLEDRLFDGTGRPARRSRRRHLRLVPGGGRGRHAAAGDGREERDAA